MRYPQFICMGCCSVGTEEGKRVRVVLGVWLKRGLWLESGKAGVSVVRVVGGWWLLMGDGGGG